MKLIKQAGGVAVLAHPWCNERYEPLVRRMAAAGLDGLEVFKYQKQSEKFMQLCQRFGLLMLGGSDYHGRIKWEGHEEVGTCVSSLSLCLSLTLTLPHSNTTEEARRAIVPRRPHSSIPPLPEEEV